MICAVAVWAVLAESVATTLKLPAPLVGAVGVPEIAPEVLSVSPATRELALASFQVTLPVPPEEASWAE